MATNSVGGTDPWRMSTNACPTASSVVASVTLIHSLAQFQNSTLFSFESCFDFSAPYSFVMSAMSSQMA